MKPKRFDSPNMSDTALLISVEDLINMAMGPPDKNVVNYKMIQTVLHILARHLRMLETQVEIRITEAPPPKEKKEKKKEPEPPSTSSSSAKSPRKVSPPPKAPLAEIKEEKVKLFQDRDKERQEKMAAKEKEKAEKAALKAKEIEDKMTREKDKKDREKAEKEREKTERAEQKDRDKSDRAASKERDKADRAASKERDKEDRAASKEKAKADRAESREREKDDKAAIKDKEKAERAESKEREKAEKAGVKEKEKTERGESKEREKAEKAGVKDKEKAERAESKEREKAERAESKERDKAEKSDAKDKEKAERAESKEREKAEKAGVKDKEKAERAESKEREKAEKAGVKDKEKAERAESKEREKAEKASVKDKEKAERAESREREKAEKAGVKDKEKAERAESREKEKEDKARDKEARAESKERDKAERAESKERDKAERAESKEREKAEQTAAKDKEKAEKERAKLEKQDAKDRNKAEKEQEKLDKANAKELDRAGREQEKLERMIAKDKERTEKEREKLEKMDAKDREKAEREIIKLEKMIAKDEERAGRDQAKLDKMNAEDKERAEREKAKLEKNEAKDKERAEKEKEKAEKEAAKEKEKMDKMSTKEREKYEKEKAKEAKEREKHEKEKAKEAKKQELEKSQKAGISIKERDKVLIVEKGPTTRPDSRTRIGSIEVVTISQFELLESVVKDLKEKAGPMPFPALPDNEKLRSELAKGSASLTDTMQAMQVAARVKAAETAIGRMAGLLTQLAAAGALPMDVAGKLEDVKAEMGAITEESGKTRQSGLPRKSVAIDPMSKRASTTSKVEAKPSLAAPRASVTSRVSVSKGSIGSPGVTHIELDDALRSLKDDLTKNVNNLTAKATAAAETASATAKAVADKLDIALKLNTRINSLYSLVTDYSEQLSGFDAGLTTQMQSFQEQMAQMRNDLKGGVTLLETANNNAETAAVMELTERYDGLVMELDNTLHAHQALTAFQKQLGDELHSLLECVEMLREQKADRDEVLDGLRDKADNSRLAGLLTEAEFASSRSELERRLDLCYDKFRKQDQVWMGAIKDLTEISEGKAEIMQLLAARDDAQQQLRDIQDRLQKLAIILGEPKAAMLTRQLSKGARCGPCQIPALQESTDISFGKPPPLPAIRPRPAGEEKPCVPEWRPPQPPDDRDHTCHRWVGGSHTLLAESVVREQAGPLQSLGPPTKKYAGYGSDGRLYMMEEELQPCIECNIISTETDKIPEENLKPGEAAQVNGAGDTGVTQTMMELPT